jgi:hypothetical protein
VNRTTVDDTPLSFGRYRGQTPEEIVRRDPQYVLWLYETHPRLVSRQLYLAADSEVEEECDEVEELHLDDSDPDCEEPDEDADEPEVD